MNEAEKLRAQGIVVTIAPMPGFYRTRLRSGGVYVGVRIWFGPPLDPDTGEEMDRGHRWQADCNGRYIEIDRVWPQCGGDPIDDDEYLHLSALQSWGESHAPDSPQAKPYMKIDLLTAPILL
jgi:hypothetical protein